MNNATETHSKKRFHWAPIIALALSFAVVGCYTILKHPVTSQEGPQDQPGDSHPQEYYRQNCIECHADYAEYPYGYFYGDYPDYYFEYPRYGHYYAYPWWWDRHWYSDTRDEDVLVEGEKAQRRGGLIPPYVTGAPAINTGGGSGGGYVAPGAALPGGKTPTGGSTGAGGEQKEKTRVKVSEVADSTQVPSGYQQAKPGEKTKRRGATKP